MLTLVVLGLIGWFAYRHFSNKKRAADRRNWSVDFRDTPIRPVTRRLPWKEFK
jgi:predicted negative regulator of RcsB-dependent stress response